MSHPDTALVQAVRCALAAAGDPERAAGQQRYMKSSMPYRGLTSPELRSLLRPLLAEHVVEDRADWEASIRTLWDEATHREERYAATALAGHRAYRTWQDPALLPLLRHLVTTGAWWDHVDEIATHHVAPILLRHRDEVTPAMHAWAVADDLWLRPTAIICQLPHKDATDLDLLTTAIDANLETTTDGGSTPYGRELFIRKAIGWALRQHARTDEVWVRDFVAARGERLSGLSRREALKRLR